ncbi:MAG TPA: hypothetical protein VLC94_10675 [Candidatus Acidoferrum sp.]|nr:hypothetical protein [Candidatus Acidoferrum sp.]
MQTELIRTLRPHVTQEDAVRAFTAPGAASFYWKLRRGPLLRIADAYIPFHLYRVRYNIGGATHSQILAMDAVDGSLDLFQFAAAPGDTETVLISTRNRLSPELCESRAEELLREKVLRLIFQHGFFKVREAGVQMNPLPGILYLPYWLGFYGSTDSLHCRVMDAVRRRIEGAKASALFEQWLAA